MIEISTKTLTSISLFRSKSTLFVETPRLKAPINQLLMCGWCQNITEQIKVDPSHLCPQLTALSFYLY